MDNKIQSTSFTKEVFFTSSDEKLMKKENKLILYDIREEIRDRIEEIIINTHLEIIMINKATKPKDTKTPKQLENLKTLFNKYISDYDLGYISHENNMDKSINKKDILELIDYKIAKHGERKLGSNQSEARVVFKSFNLIGEILKNEGVHKCRAIAKEILTVNKLYVNTTLRTDEHEGFFI